MEFSGFIRWTFLSMSDFTFLHLTFFLRCLQISVDWRCFSHNLVESISFNWSNIFWENWILTDLHIALIDKPWPSLKRSTAKWRARFISLTELTLSLGAYCHTMWWNDSLAFCVPHFSTETKNSFFQRRSNNGLMTFTVVSGNGFLIGLWNELPVATFLWKLHQLPLPGGRWLCNISSL